MSTPSAENGTIELMTGIHRDQRPALTSRDLEHELKTAFVGNYATAASLTSGAGVAGRLLEGRSRHRLGGLDGVS